MTTVEMVEKFEVTDDEKELIGRVVVTDAAKLISIGNLNPFGWGAAKKEEPKDKNEIKAQVFKRLKNHERMIFAEGRSANQRQLRTLPPVQRPSVLVSGRLPGRPLAVRAVEGQAHSFLQSAAARNQADRGEEVRGRRQVRSSESAISARNSSRKTRNCATRRRRRGRE